MNTPSDPTYTLHLYDHRFDAGLAQMWNESDDQWPGTFTDGVPMTEERIHDWMDRVEAIVKFIIVKNGGDEPEKVVGYGDLWNTATRPGSAYVALLNVSPAHQGKSLARRMLHRMVDWAVENKYDRVTIGTWPANLKAMPLYKKVGFFWEPGTSVHMENYLPAVRLHPLAQPYFNKHDWYKTYRRDLSQVEDDMRHPCTGDTKVYILRWEEDGDQLETVFDRNAQALTGFATSGFDGAPAWAAFARAGESEPAQGIAYPMEWEVINRSNVPLTVKISVKADEGISIRHHTSYTLQPGERKMTTANFRVAPDAPKYHGEHHDLPKPKITTHLEINGQKLEFGTGLRYRPAVEFSLHPSIVSLLPGVAQTVHLQLRSRAKRALTGTVKLNLPDGLTAEWQTTSFETPSEGYAGIPLTLTAQKGGFYPLELCAEFDDAGTTVTTQPKRLPVVAVNPGGYAAGLGDEELILENDYFRITAKAKSGEAKIWNKDLQREEALFREEIGPAFVPLDLYEQEYNLDVHQTDGTAKAILTVRSTRFPGLVVGREIAVNASPLIRIRGWVSNNTDETSRRIATASARLH
ncbi:MAG: GNAT family N-acetyltransferase [Anaerolineales bacterium]|nr:GNAT family N-acetyltransferase [Anaerolineales bacterium]